MKLFFRVFRYAHHLKVLFPQYVLYIFLSAAFSVVNFAMLIPLLNVLFGQDTVKQFEKPTEFSLSLDYATDYFNYYFTTIVENQGKKEALMFVCLVVVVSVLLTNVFRYLAAIVSARVRLDVIKNLRMAIYNRVSIMHLGFFSNERKGDLMSRITNDVQEVENSVLNSPKSLLREPVQVVFYFITLFAISYKLTLFTILILPISGGVLGYVVKKLKRKAVQSQESLGRIVNILDETLGGIRIVKAFNALNYVRKKMDDETDFFKKVNLSYAHRKEMGSPISEVLGVGIVTIILYYGGSLVLENDASLNASQFIAYLAIFSQIISPAKAFSQGISTVPKGLVAAERIFSVVDTTPAITNKPNAQVLPSFENELTFEHVDFAYDKEKVLSDINVTIPKGKMVALVGPSGGGKSTLADLIPRFYDPTGGSIKIDGIDLRDYDIDSIRKHMGIVTQESILFNDTIFNNIAFGLEDAKREDVIQAAKIANAHQFIEGMENGYDTNIGDRGMKLSGGQRQRISIARAVLKNPPILILDEATSALDSESERLVQDALSNLMKNRTSLVIAHRLSTIQYADEIVVIQDGKVIERGSHAELLSQEGVYKKLNLMQNT
ncbi:ABC transporter ATP-binding protein/permease [Fulvivirga maritima]|uniref:ABC transporter ATP-binding protein n=1 Tax=Fulvivirga maritima TaxID=2904247 RepID=UPI001F23F876|nr:ABC transporter ATP-binding protein [Fulvivirga maritima]UII28925.1 ABC transporter ATP-binding protein/permease [Fulvivirga maritima]